MHEGIQRDDTGRFTMDRRWLIALVVVPALALAAACSDNGGEDEIPKPSPTASIQDDATGIDFVSSSGIIGGDPDFNLSALVWQGYWLSRDHFGPFVMASGMGIPFEPPMDMLMAAIGMIAQNPDDPVVIPQNMLPLQAVFASASSDLVNDPRDFEPPDFEAFRLDPDTFDERVTVRGQAETMLKESQWAHNFADAHFGDPLSEFGAQQRFIGVMVSLLAQMQGMYAMQNLLGEDGLYYDSDGEIDYVGNWVMLHTLADIAGLTGDEGGRYANPDAHPMFEGAATQLFRALEAREPSSATEAAAAIRALVYLASTTGDAGVRDDALVAAGSIGNRLLGGNASAGVVEVAAAITGAISAGAAGLDGDFLDEADALFGRLTEDYDETRGIFKTKDTYTSDDVGWIIGALNFLVQEGNDTSKPEAARMLLGFYESTISLGGMQLSAPPGKSGAMAGAFEMDLPSVVYYHPADTPPPPLVGKLTIPAQEITWDGAQWQVTDDRFVPAGAMHLANELNWLGPHLGSVPFPLLATDDLVQDIPSLSAERTIIGENISFDHELVTASVGEEITLTFDNRDADIPHNLHVQAGPEGDFRTEIAPGPVTQTLVLTINTPGRYPFVCDVHPAQMKGTLVVR